MKKKKTFSKHEGGRVVSANGVIIIIGSILH